MAFCSKVNVFNFNYNKKQILPEEEKQDKVSPVNIYKPKYKLFFFITSSLPIYQPCCFWPMTLPSLYLLQINISWNKKQTLSLLEIFLLLVHFLHYTLVSYLIKYSQCAAGEIFNFLYFAEGGSHRHTLYITFWSLNWRVGLEGS